MTRLILIRHGETDWNVENRRQGRNDRPLNSKGRAQAKLVADYVRATFDIKKVWSSPLKRCVETATLLDMPVSTSDLLLEIDYGDWEGMLESEIDAKYPNRYQNGTVSIDPPGGEERSNLPVRARQFLEESRIAEEGGNVVIVGHGSAMSGLLVALFGLPDHAMHNFVIDNCSVSTIQMENDINRLTTLNHTVHLAIANGT
ncbi:MAG: histidine phosphatase family protein [Chloroflexi bacterium]|nr:histidine phosphatase family protein [Chloroflexota bacterium]MCH8115176.1 histidine phosphatase family protein [Chloroflexota bacterium]MCI0774561.1 histidine phosphatase family protein [Chloroflexota bacterium]MCI0802921.1 histidine phosphatase family protein [Chloroflexota bacterium]MCI0808926.1 histidine phosphatase family protein [Chloroflexota bacterium]